MVSSESLITMVICSVWLVSRESLITMVICSVWLNWDLIGLIWFKKLRTQEVKILCDQISHPFNFLNCVCAGAVCVHKSVCVCVCKR